MREELLTPAALLAQSILKSTESGHSALTQDIVASAFEDAYRAIEKAEAHIKAEDVRKVNDMVRRSARQQ